MSRRFWLYVAGAIIFMLLLFLLPMEPPEPMDANEWTMELLMRAREEVDDSTCTELAYVPALSLYVPCCRAAFLNQPPPAPWFALMHMRNYVLVWLFGFGLSALFFVTQHIRLLRRLKRWRTEETDIAIHKVLINEKEHLNITRSIALCKHKLISTPITVGIVHPAILLPRKAYDSAALPLILRHELIHIKNKDVFRKYALIALRCIFWFNPFVHMLALQANKDFELVCDTLTLQGQDESIKKSYADLLIQSASEDVNP
jgi:beta-lactamase regulating signal transducer with metallopeptidase domain